MPQIKEYRYEVNIWLREPITYFNGDVEMTNAVYVGFTLFRYPSVTDSVIHAGEWIIPIANIRAMQVIEREA